MPVKSCFPRHFKQGGLALVIVIWILTLLTLMAGSFAMTMRRDSSVSVAIKSNAEALAEAEAGIMIAQFMLAQTDAERRWLADGTVYQLIRPDGEVRIRIQSEAGKVDINTSNDTQLAALINAVTSDNWQQQQLLNAILDWRDSDDETRTMGAERRQYRLAGLFYEPSNSAFQSVEELQLVLGMNEVIFKAMEPFITVYSGQAEVDLRYASPQLLAILARELKERNIDDTALQQRLDAPSQTDDVSGVEEGATDVENQTYTITAEASIGDDASAGLEVVAKKQESNTGSPFQVLDWKQIVQGPSLFDGTMEYSVITIQDEFRYGDRD